MIDQHKTLSEKLNNLWKLIEKIITDINIKIISDFLDWFCHKLKLQNNLNNNKFPKQWEIWNIKIWLNIWSEQNWEQKWWYTRPCLIVRTFWVKNDNLIVFPLTKSKKPDYISFILDNNVYKFLKYKKSYILLDQIRTISKQRLIWVPIWKISTKDLEVIITKFKELIIINDKNRLKNMS